VALDQFRHKWEWNIDTNYTTILANLTQVNNPRACFLTRIQTIYAKKHSPWLCLNDLAHTTDGGHNVASYLVILFLYWCNGDAEDDDTMRRYIRWVKGEEESRVMAAGAGGGPTSRWQRNKGCVL
jgi:hypothetical protein